MNSGSVKGTMELATEGVPQGNLPVRNSPAPQVQNASIKALSTDKNLDQSYSLVPIQSISPTKTVNKKARKSDHFKKYYAAVESPKKETDYALPSTTLPKRPSLFADRLEARTLSTDPTYSSLYITPKCEWDFTVSEVLSPVSLQPVNVEVEDPIQDGEVVITRMPNKG